MSDPPLRIAIAGGGAAGYFAAIAAAEECAERNVPAEVTILEASPQPLAKVLVSGGGRCNVTRACFDPRELADGYPRGARELLGAFHRWQPQDTIEWFKSHGVPLVTQSDLRVFPAADTAQAITDCLQRTAARARVKVRTRCRVTDIIKSALHFTLALTSGETLECDRLLVATGGMQKKSSPQSPQSPQFAAIEQLGHTIEPPVPSLFSFNINDPRLHGLTGLAVENAVVSIPETPLRETGGVLVTHWGLSGPAILKLSSRGARTLHERDYKFPLVVNWLGETAENIRAALTAARASHARRQIATWNPFAISTRLWKYLLQTAGIAETAIWANTSNAHLAALAAHIGACEFAVTGKSTNKDEFVTCGGVRLKEVDFKTMQSRVCAGLYFAGEVLDIDGITGGYNLQAAWTTGRLAGLAMAKCRVGA